MRLDEAQRWLDAQVVDEEPTPQLPPVKAKPLVVTARMEPPVVEPAALADEHVETARTPAASSLDRVEMPSTPSVEALSEEPSVPQVAPVVSAQPETQAVTAETAREVPAPPPPTIPTVVRPARPAVSFETPDGDLEVPTIDKYLPFLRKREPEVADVDTAPASGPMPEESKPAPTVAPLPAPIAADREDERAAEEPQTGVTPTVAAALLQSIAVENQPTQEELAALGLAAPMEREAQPAGGQGMLHRRARHARNVRPAEVVEEMNAETLWSLVPKHVQTLIALESDEVTQHSYSRRFKESRLELLHRLLDPTLSLEETARLLNVCPTTVRRYTNRGLLTHQRTAGDQRRFKLSDVLAFLEAQSGSRT